jgi:hypothetical protein
MPITGNGRLSLACRCGYGMYTYLLSKSSIFIPPHPTPSHPPLSIYSLDLLSPILPMSALNILLYLQHTHLKRTPSPKTPNTFSNSQHVIPNSLPKSHQDASDHPVVSQRIPHLRQPHCYDGQSCHQTRSFAIPRPILPCNSPVRKGSRETVGFRLRRDEKNITASSF